MPDGPSFYHISGKTNTAADALCRTVLPSQPEDHDEPNSFLVYPDIADIYNIEHNKVEWTLEYKKSSLIPGHGVRQKWNNPF